MSRVRIAGARESGIEVLVSLYCPACKGTPTFRVIADPGEERRVTRVVRCECGEEQVVFVRVGKWATR